jgi:hypothetical protein
VWDRRETYTRGETIMANQNQETVTHLNSFLRGELAAVETYRQAHEGRVTALTEEVMRRGGKPAQTSGAWGSFAKLIEGGAAVFGERAAIAALEEGEDHGRDDYKRDLKSLDTPAQAFIQAQILPEQQRTHDTISRLKKSFH